MGQVGVATEPRGTESEHALDADTGSEGPIQTSAQLLRLFSDSNVKSVQRMNHPAGTGSSMD